MVSIKDKISNRVSNPNRLTEYLFRTICGHWLPSKLYLSVLYRLNIRGKLNWESPRSFNEKLNWVKVYDRNPLYTKLADKYAVKAFIEERIGKQYVVDNYGVWDSWESIDFEKLPNQFVLKCTHDSGGAFVCRDKETFDFKSVQKRVCKNLKKNPYYATREWPYRNIHPRIIADKLLVDNTGEELRDYKFWCFNGKPTYMYCTIKADEIYENFYDMDFHPVMIDHGFPRHIPEFEKPVCFEEMKQLAAVLSKEIPFVRVDFFQVDGKVYFGEFTFFDWGGTVPFGGDWDEKIGELIKLPNKRQ